VGIVCNEMRSKLRATGTKKSAKRKSSVNNIQRFAYCSVKFKKMTGHYANIFVLSTQPALHLKTQLSYTNKYLNAV